MNPPSTQIPTKPNPTHSLNLNPNFETELPGGLDLMSSVQILLVKNYDEQLLGIKNQMEAALVVKKQYRQDIEAQQKILTNPSEKIDDKFYVPLNTSEEQRSFQKNSDYQTNWEAKEGEAKFKDGSTWMSPQEFQEKTKQKDGKVYVEKSQLENKLEILNQKLDGMNEQSELTSVQLQSLTNQRKIAFETLSQLLRKQHETLGTMVRNLQG